MEIIPAIDIIDGQCVRLERGLYDKSKVYHTDPLEVAKSFEDHGLNRLHLVDLDGAKAKKVINWPVVERIARHTHLKIDFGGGIKSTADLESVLQSGASQVTIGSIAAKDPKLFLTWLDHYGPEKIILGADLKNGHIATQGWMEETEHHWRPFIEQYVGNGIVHIICTDIAKDGMLSGPASELYKQILSAFPDIKLTASGGVTNMKDVMQMHDLGCWGCIIGKAIYEGTISLEELQNFVDAS